MPVKNWKQMKLEVLVCSRRHDHSKPTCHEARTLLDSALLKSWSFSVSVRPSTTCTQSGIAHQWSSMHIIHCTSLHANHMTYWTYWPHPSPLGQFRQSLWCCPYLQLPPLAHSDLELDLKPFPAAGPGFFSKDDVWRMWRLTRAC